MIESEEDFSSEGLPVFRYLDDALARSHRLKGLEAAVFAAGGNLEEFRKLMRPPDQEKNREADRLAEEKKKAVSLRHWNAKKEHRKVHGREPENKIARACKDLPKEKKLKLPSSYVKQKNSP